MKSYTIGRNLYGTLTKNTSSANLTLGDQIANDDYRAICAMKDWPFLEKRRPLTTTTAQFINLPYDCDQVREIEVAVSNITYVPRQSPSRAHWGRLNMNPITSDIPQWWFVFNGQIGLWPTPSAGGNTLYVTQKTRVIDLSIADYATGTVSAIANGATAVTGSGTSWTPQMVGRYIKITYSDTANTGDGLWYEITAVPSATSLTLSRAYGGTTIAAGSAAYIIGQMPLLPEAFHDMPWMYAIGTYWAKESDKRGQYFLDQHGEPPRGGAPATGRIKLLIDQWSSPTTDMVIDDGGGQDILNPNLTITL